MIRRTVLQRGQAATKTEKDIWNTNPSTGSERLGGSGNILKKGAGIN
jgi:hypothetical protein